MKLILGSSSNSRKKILFEMGYDFEVMTPDIDERAIRRNDPRELVLAIAEAKMDALLERVHEPAVVIAADSVMYADGELREKPRDKREAYKFIETFSKVPQICITAVVVVNTQNGARESVVDESSIIFNEIPMENIRTFVESGEALNYAGGLVFEDPLFEPYIKEFQGEHTSMMGLPKSVVDELLKEMLG